MCLKYYLNFPFANLFSYYEGILPVLVISDVEMIKQILVSDFSKFNVRKVCLNIACLINSILFLLS